MSARVLMIDDEPELTELAGAYLRLNGFEVEAFNDPLAGLARLKAESFDAVILDLMMLPLDGLSVLRQLRELPGHSLTPVFVLSAKRLEEDERTDLLRFNVHFIPKPFHPARLVQSLRTAVTAA